MQKKGLLAAAAAALLGGCAAMDPALGGASAGQTPEQTRQIMERLTPTVRGVSDADIDILRDAASGYLARWGVEPEDPARPYSALRPDERLVQTPRFEFREDGWPHQTRIAVKLTPEAPGSRYVRLQVYVLAIEATPVLTSARSGEPLVYDWRLVGSNKKAEEAIAQKIYERYLALVEKRPLPPDDEIDSPIPTRKAG